MKSRSHPRKVAGKRVAVLGAGSWGTTFAKILADGGADVVMWARRPEVAREIQEAKRNSDYLPGVNLPLGVRATSRLDLALAGAEQVYVSVPSQSLRDNLKVFAPHLNANAIVISLMKGVEKSSGMRMSEVIADVLSHRRVADRRHLGPEPRARDRQGAADGGGRLVDEPRDCPGGGIRRPQSLLPFVREHRRHRNRVRRRAEEPHRGRDRHRRRCGLRRQHEGVDHHARPRRDDRLRRRLRRAPRDALGLAGLGDLIATSQSPLSRNNTAGRLLGQGYHLNDVVNQMQQTTEGLASVGPILELARAKGVEMPIVEQVRQVLAGTLDPKDIAPHLTTDDEPQGERTKDGQAEGGSAVRRAFKRAFDQLRYGGRGAGGDRP